MPLTLICKKEINFTFPQPPYLLVFSTPSVARTVYRFLGSLSRLPCSRRTVGFLLTRNPFDIKSYKQATSIPLSNTVESQSVP